MRSGPGFKIGFATLLTAARFLVQTPALWVFAAVPALLLTLLAGLDVALVASFVPPWLREVLPELGGWYGRIATSTLVVIGSIAVGLLGLLGAVLLTPVLSAPALEHLVGAREAALGVPAGPELGLLAEMFCGLRAALLGAALALPAVFLLTLLELFVPPSAIVVTPLKFSLVSLSLAWSLIDYPLTLRGVPMRERLRLFRRYPAALFGFGLCFSLLFWAPCCSVLLLPVGVVAATDLVWAIVRSDPEGSRRLTEPRRPDAA